MYTNSPGHQNGVNMQPYPLSSHRQLEPEEDVNYFQEEDDDYYDEEVDEQQQQYYEEDEEFSQEEVDDDAHYQDNEQYDYPQAEYSAQIHEDEPPSLSPRLPAPEGMSESFPKFQHANSLAREQLGYPLGEEEGGPQDEREEVGGEDAVLDLAELEQLQEEAERMKGLGNKHMAAQEYTRAYNAYSAALQLSPVGPSSHVFLSNRAASLLSLKRYSAAAVDARRAVALAPTFGKAHARLGQALYFLKQYEGAVQAYEDAIRFEEEGSGSNGAVTRAYLIKAKEKLALQEEKERRKQMMNNSGGGVDDGVTVGEESAFHGAYSVVTDKEGRGLASGQMVSERIQTLAKEEGDKQMGLIVENEEENGVPRGSLFDEQPGRVSSPTMMYVETGPMGGPAQRRVEPPQDRGFAPAAAVPTDDNEEGGDEPDPDFDEALRLQRRATQFLSHKKYKNAVDDFSAALFLVPDDPVLTPQLHVGRAHALNGQERFESAKNDALMALRHILRSGEEDVSAAEAYSVLGKSLYYTKDYQGAMEALEECERVWKLNGGKLSVFDEAYLEQCHEALDAGLGVDHADGTSMGGGASVVSNGVKSVVSTLKEGKPLTNIPKLKPPRFVSREQALQHSHNIRPPPKSWPQQSPTSPSSIATGPERPVIFLSDAMGIKLNRGNDGLVRVISVADLPPGSPILRKGKIETGDLVREAGGVDLRRPITATMWGDTVALIKMAPRPITIIVATEITSNLNGARSPRTNGQRFDYGSAAFGEESVTGLMSTLEARGQHDHKNWEDTMRAMGVVPPSPASGEEALGGSETGSLEVTSTLKSSCVHVAEEKSPGEVEKIQQSDQTKTGDGAESSIVEAGDETSHDVPEQVNNSSEGVETKAAEPKSSSIDASIVESGDGPDTDIKKCASQNNSSDNLHKPEDTPESCIGNDIKGTPASEKGQEIADEVGSDVLTRQSDGDAANCSKEEEEEASSSQTTALETADDDKKSSNQRVQSDEDAEVQQDMDNVDSATAPPPSLNCQILFDDSKISICALDDGSDASKKNIQGSTNKKWASLQPELVFSGPVTRIIHEKKLFWSTESYRKRTLAIFNYNDPTGNPPAETGIILILRDPTDMEEARRLNPGKEQNASVFIAESVIDPMTCKLRLSQLTTPTSIPLDDNCPNPKSGKQKRSFFELLTPTGSIALSAVAKKDGSESINVNSIVKTTKYEDAVSNALLSAHSSTEGLDDSRASVTHQIVLGTLHSYVISGNDKLLQNALANALELKKSKDVDAEEVVKLDSTVVDARDTNWRTALHYAAERKHSSMVGLLIDAGANFMIPMMDGHTPLHICAQNLDDKCLSIILSATHPIRPDPNALNLRGQTPMYLAAIQGNDAPALARCLAALNAWGGQFFPLQETAQSKKLLHPVHCLSFQWKHEQLATLLPYVSHQYPLTSSDLGGMSLSAKFAYPLHAALISLREQMFSAIDSNTYDPLTSSRHIVKTIQVLLEHGVEPNERFEGVVGDGDNIKLLSEYFGFSPLQILATIGKELRSIEHQKHEAGGNSNNTPGQIKVTLLETIQLAADLLLQNGARTNLPPPPPSRLDRETPMGCFSFKESLEDRTATHTPLIDRKELNFDGDEMIALLGGKARVQTLQKRFAEMPKANRTLTLNIHVDMSSVPDSNEPGGSDINSCSICWSEFGVITNRKQFCQISTRHVCNDCSTKRLFEGGRDFRVSDGQYLFAKAQEAKRAVSHTMTQRVVASEKEPSPESKNKVSLGLYSKARSSASSNTKNEPSMKEKFSSAVSGLGQTRDAVLERGSKLEGLADKTDALNKASLDFSNMAKELNRQQNSWW